MATPTRGGGRIRPAPKKRNSALSGERGEVAQGASYQREIVRLLCAEASELVSVAIALGKKHLNMARPCSAGRDKVAFLTALDQPRPPSSRRVTGRRIEQPQKRELDRRPERQGAG